MDSIRDFAINCYTNENAFNFTTYTNNVKLSTISLNANTYYALRISHGQVLEKKKSYSWWLHF
jgi:hypothetical protein